MKEITETIESLQAAADLPNSLGEQQCTCPLAVFSAWNPPHSFSLFGLIVG